MGIKITTFQNYPFPRLLTIVCIATALLINSVDLWSVISINLPIPWHVPVRSSSSTWSFRSRGWSRANDLEITTFSRYYRISGTDVVHNLSVMVRKWVGRTPSAATVSRNARKAQRSKSKDHRSLTSSKRVVSMRAIIVVVMRQQRSTVRAGRTGAVSLTWKFTVLDYTGKLPNLEKWQSLFDRIRIELIMIVVLFDKPFFLISYRFPGTHWVYVSFLKSQFPMTMSRALPYPGRQRWTGRSAAWRLRRRSSSRSSSCRRPHPCIAWNLNFWISRQINATNGCAVEIWTGEWIVGEWERIGQEIRSVKEETDRVTEALREGIKWETDICLFQEKVTRRWM